MPVTVFEFPFPTPFFIFDGIHALASVLRTNICLVIFLSLLCPVLSSSFSSTTLLLYRCLRRRIQRAVETFKWHSLVSDICCCFMLALLSPFSFTSHVLLLLPFLSYLGAFTWHLALLLVYWTPSLLTFSMEMN